MKSQTLNNLLLHGIARLKSAAVFRIERSNREETVITADQFAGDDRTEVLAAAKTLTDKDSGTTFFLDLAGGFQVDLPLPKAGLSFEFIVSTAPTTAYIIASSAGADVIVAELHEIAGGAGTYDDNADVVNFVASTAVVGDRMKVSCDGTNWFGLGSYNALGGMTTATT